MEPQLRLGPINTQKRTWPISSHLDITLAQKPIYLERLQFAVKKLKYKNIDYFHVKILVKVPKNPDEREKSKLDEQTLAD